MSKSQSLNYILKGTRTAIDDVVSKWYADCYLDERDAKRLMIWQSKLEKLLEDRK